MGSHDRGSAVADTDLSRAKADPLGNVEMVEQRGVAGFPVPWGLERTTRSRSELEHIVQLLRGLADRAQALSLSYPRLGHLLIQRVGQGGDIYDETPLRDANTVRLERDYRVLRWSTEPQSGRSHVFYGPIDHAEGVRELERLAHAASRCLERVAPGPAQERDMSRWLTDLYSLGVAGHPFLQWCRRVRIGVFVMPYWCVELWRSEPRARSQLEETIWSIPLSDLPADSPNFWFASLPTDCFAASGAALTLATQQVRELRERVREPRWRPARWFSEATRGSMGSERLRKAKDAERIVGQKRGKSWLYDVNSVIIRWPEFREQIERHLQGG